MRAGNITLVIPVHNRERLIGRTLDSVAAQTWRPLRLILVDNGSTDGSPALCEAFRRKHAADDFHIDVLSETSPGAACARNCGLAACTTSYVYFFDSDDELSPDFIECMEGIISRGAPDLIAFPTNEVKGGRICRRPFTVSGKPSVQILNSMLTTQSMLFRTDWLRRLGGWNGRLSIWMDWELGVRALLASPAVCWYDRQAFHRIHIHPDSITGCTYAARYEKLMQTMQQVRYELDESNGSEEGKKRNNTALYFRQMILSAKLMGEHAPEASADCLQRVRREFSVDIRTRLYGRFLYEYTRRGGRGAWRLALFLL